MTNEKKDTAMEAALHPIFEKGFDKVGEVYAAKRMLLKRQRRVFCFASEER